VATAGSRLAPRRSGLGRAPLDCRAGVFGRRACPVGPGRLGAAAPDRPVGGRAWRAGPRL